MSEKEMYPSESAERFQLRLPDGLRDRIKAHANQHDRSMNTVIVRVLEHEFPETPVSSAKGSWEGPPLRDWFAGQALAGMLANPGTIATEIGLRSMYLMAAQASYLCADAMIAEREKGGAK